jgi:hypothetical protein
LGAATEAQLGISQKRGDQGMLGKMGNFVWAKRLRYGSTSWVSRRSLESGSPRGVAGRD